MPDKITNYQCPACMGPLRFDAAADALLCDYCGSRYSVTEIQALYQEKDQAAAAAQASEEQAAAVPEADAGDWDMSALRTDWGAESDMRVYNCPSCGAELICEETTAATRCPYCGNPAIVPGQLSGALRPDYVIPFRLDKEAAVAALRQYYRKRLLLPRAFSEKNHLQEAQGVYVPFWLFDTEMDADITYSASNTRSHREGDYRVTNTDHFLVERSGRVSFRRVPVDASSRMPDDYMDSVEPYDYGELREFSAAYLPGYLADKYDVDAAQSARRAERRCANSTKDIFRRDVGGYSSVTERSSSVRVGGGAVHYALLPVWVLHTRWGGKDFLFTINGQTGRPVGDLPVSKGRYLAMLLGTGAVFAGIFLLTGIAGFLNGLLGGFPL